MEAGPVVTLVVGPPMESNCCESKVLMGSSEDVNDPPPKAGSEKMGMWLVVPDVMAGYLFVPQLLTCLFQ